MKKQQKRETPAPSKARSPTPGPASCCRSSPGRSRHDALEREGRICPNKHRLTQVARTGGRKLFDAGRRELFLEWFAATCNVKLSAEKAGVCYQTVFKHRMKDEAFAEAWDRALQQGYAYLEARLLQEAVGRETCPSTASTGSGRTSLGTNGNGDEQALPQPLPRAGGEAFDEAVADAAFDPELAIVLLREHSRRLPGSADKRKQFRPGHRVASNAEVRDALVKRLKAFGIRIAKEAPPPRKARSPSPATAGEDD